MNAIATATSVARYINNVTGTLRDRGYTSEISQLEQSRAYGPWSLKLAVTLPEDTAAACVFELDIDPADGEGVNAEIPHMDVDFADVEVTHRRERRAEVREQLYMSLSDSEIGDDFYNYGYNFLLVADALATCVAATELADLAA